MKSDFPVDLTVKPSVFGLRKPVGTWYGWRESDYPDDARCAVDGCGHRHDVHSYASNCGHCDGCDRPDGVFDQKAFHYFEPTRLAGGTRSATEEREAYERALRGEA